MSISALQATSLEADHQYGVGLAHLQGGRWEEAIDCFEGVSRRNPHSATVQRVLQEARFKAGLDGGKRVRARRWIIPWRPWLVRGMIVVVIGTLGVGAGRLITSQVAPVFARAQTELRQAEVLSEANALLEAGDLDAAEVHYELLLAEVPEHDDALAGLAQITAQRELENLYEDALAFQEIADWDGALEKLNEIEASAPRYRDVRQRIVALRRYHDLEGPFAEAEAAFEAGHTLVAIRRYEEIRNTDVSYRSDTVVSRLVDLHIRAGRELIEADPPGPQAVAEAVECFRQALALQPRSTEASVELEVALLFLEGQELYHEGSWSEAVSRLRALFDQRPQYLGTAVVYLLYDAYLESGDEHRENGDFYRAYELYRKAEQLPVADTTWAQHRLARVVAMLTPTPTPTATPTPTQTPTPSPTGTPVIKAVSQGPLKITGWYVIDRQLVPNEPEWEGRIGINFAGGMAPLKFALENGAPQTDNDLHIRWRVCEPAPVTLHIWSADGQEAHHKIVIPRWCP